MGRNRAHTSKQFTGVPQDRLQEGRSVFQTPARVEMEWLLCDEWTDEDSSMAEGLRPSGRDHIESR